jgi:hypothetical protein
MLDPGAEDEVGRIIESFPPKDHPHRAFYLANDGVLSATAPAEAGSVSYSVSQIPGAVFHIAVREESEVLGYCKLKLWVEAEGADDMDLVVLLEKRSASGRAPIPRYNPYGEPAPLQAMGMLRVSRRELDPARSTPTEPFLKLQGERRLKPGEIVPVEIGFWPIGFKVHAGESLQVTVIPFHTMPTPFGLGQGAIDIPADRYTFDPKHPPRMLTLSGSSAMEPAWVSSQAVGPDDRNKGTHRIHYGGKFDSHLLVPLKAVNQ